MMGSNAAISEPDLPHLESPRAQTPAPTTAPENNGVTVNITIIRPDGYTHASAFNEIAESLKFSFEQMGFISDYTENVLIDNGVNIILGAHLLTGEQINAIPESSIIYNFEQITDSSTWMTPEYLGLYHKFDIWDYSKSNIEALRLKGLAAKVTHVPLGYTDNLTRIPKLEHQDIDVLFYGSVNERRQNILNDLTAAGLNVQSLFDVYGTERDNFISRAKLVLNLHYYESNVFEQARVSYLLANSKAVVAELTPNTNLDDGLEHAVAWAPYEKLVETCCELVRSAQIRERLEKDGFRYISARSTIEYLSSAISNPGQPTTNQINPTHPLKLNIGSGKDFMNDALNLDVSENCNPDAITDLSDQSLLGTTVQTRRFGDITFKEEQFEEIIAYDVLEHIPDLVTAMTNCLAILKVGGNFTINVPYDMSYGAWQDPTHVRAFNERSWLYYTDWYWYLGWHEYRFDLTKLEYGLSPIGQQKQQSGVQLQDLLFLPRAIDNMQVTLTKRPLTDAEKLFTRQRMSGV